MSNRPKVLVAMSGGVDSSVAAGLLAEQGHDVVGVFMRLGNRHLPSRRATPAEASCTAGLDAADLPSAECQTASVGSRSNEPSTAAAQSSAGSQTAQSPRGCCSAADAADARAVAGRLTIPFYVLNYEHEFARLIDYFADEYAAARTPNPCVRCNEWLKFGRLAAYADALGAEAIATGHYARVRVDAGRARLRRGQDRAKDQSYVLFSIPPTILRRTLFPLGDLTKQDVRDHARRLNLTLHDKPESQDICFVPDGDYAALVRERRPDAVRPGVIRHVDGRILGAHDGLIRFTIGQRHGLGVATGSPAYVTELNAATGEVVIGPREALLSPTASAGGACWLAAEPAAPFRANAQIRYQHAAVPSTIAPQPGGRVRVQFDEPQSAVTPGQAIVFYDGDEVLGGAWIDGR